MTTSRSSVGDFKQFRVYGDARVSAEFGLDNDYENLITVRTEDENAWQIMLSPWAARKLARRLTQMANFIEPPKKKKRTASS
jgi:hypothetical protein